MVRAIPSLFAAAIAPGNRYAAFLGALLIAQTVARLLFHISKFQIVPLGIALHLLGIASFLTFVALFVSRLPERWRGLPLAGAAIVLMLGPVHAVTTYFDLTYIVWEHLTKSRPPVWMPVTDPAMAMALLASIGIGIDTVLAAALTLLAAHLLLYVPVAARLARLARRAMRSRVPAGRGRSVRGDALATAFLAVFVALVFLLPKQTWRRELLHNSMPLALQMAPPDLMMGRRPRDMRLPAAPPLTRPRPLVLIVVDALRPDRMSVYDPALDTTPFLRRLQREGTLHGFGPAYSTCTFSFCGIMSLLASRSWDNFGAAPPTVIDMLSRQSYRSYVLLSGRQRDFGRLPTLFGDGVAMLRDQDSIGADDRNIARWLREIDFPDPRRSFLYLHLMSTHLGTAIEPRFMPRGGVTAPYPRIYDAKVRQADAMIEDIFAALHAKGLLEDALVVISSDHGERLGEGGAWYHGGPPDEAAIAVPILVYDASGVKWPARALASTIDVAPTLMRGAGGSPGPGWRGQPLQEPARIEAVPIGTVEITGVIAALGGRTYQYLCRRDDGVERVLLLDGSPGGRPVPGAPPSLTDRLRGLHRSTAGLHYGPVCR